MLTEFDYAPRTRVIYKAGALNQLGDLAVEQGGQRVLLVTDSGLREAGHEERAMSSLRQVNLDIAVFDDTHCNPTTEDIAKGLEVAREHNADMIIGLGGGSSMDCAKGINFLFTNGGKMEDYWGVGKATKPMLPLIAIPTTSGTGSEAQSFALIANAETHMKMACGDRKAAAKIAILDPELTTTMPASVTAVTGLDAISHAIETYVTKPRNTLSQIFSRNAWRLLAAGFSRVLDAPDDIEARGRMLVGAHFAGAAIENSMLGATHALANPLSAHFGTTHGIAIGILLPHVIRYNSNVVGKFYGDLAEIAEVADHDDPEAANKLAEFVRQLVERSGCPTTMSAANIDPDLIPIMAEEAAKQWTGTFNPRPVTAQSLLEIYKCAL